MLTGNGTATKTAPAKFDSVTGHWRAELQTPPGQFVLTATAMANGTLFGDDKQILVCEDADLEMSEVRADPELMKRVAEISGGQSLTPDAAGQNLLLSKLKTETSASVEYQRTPIWARWPYLALVIGLLTTEWVVRRTRGLA